MQCEQIAELLPDYLQDSLPAAQHKQVVEHIAACAPCSEEVALWQKLSLLPFEQPSPESRARFEAMLRAYQAGSSEQVVSHPEERKRASFWSAFNWFRSPLGAVAWSVALLVVGAFIGIRWNNSASRTPELTAMHTELTNMRQLVVLSMLQQQSDSTRLQGVSWSGREEQLDPQVLAALLHTLRYDTSVDVRLAALDALGRHGRQPQVHQEVANALQEQQSPLVQVALIDLLLEWKDPDAAKRLENLRQVPNLNPTVRQRADWAISKLN